MFTCVFRRIAILLLALTLLSSWSGVSSFSQTSPNDLRGMKPAEYAKAVSKKIAAQRPKSSRQKKSAAASYVAKNIDNSPVVEGVDVGVTFWRLREARPAESLIAAETTRRVKRVKGKEVETTVKMIPVRAESDTAFADGDILRFSIEMPYEAYLYIINREQYSDGSLGDPYLVFPSRSDMGRSDRGAAGRLLYVPSQTDHFEIVSLDDRGAKRRAEVFSFILSPKPIEELPPLRNDEENRKVELPLMERWEREWSAKVWKFEKAGSIGAAITKVEKAAGAASGGLLTEGDPPPQTVYHIARKPGESLLFTFPVRIRN